jgi:hypothetical protein
MTFEIFQKLNIVMEFKIWSKDITFDFIAQIKKIKY